MYISGSQYNFEQRLHQLPTGIYDVGQFLIESSGYSFVGNSGLKVDREFGRRYYSVTHDASYLRTGYVD